MPSSADEDFLATAPVNTSLPSGVYNSKYGSKSSIVSSLILFLSFAEKSIKSFKKF
jgi:hypothetical protein